MEYIPWGEGTSGSREEIGKGHGRVNIVQIPYTRHVKGKMRPVETISGMIGGRIKQNDGGGQLKYDILLDIF
jgi:hypothetical protein